MPTPSLSIIIPTWNEAHNLPQLCKRIHRTLKHLAYEIVIVDDHSTDNTWQIARQLTRSYPLQRFQKCGAKGKAFSLLEGFEYAQGQSIAMIDADLQYPPEALKPMLALCQQTNVIVVADRTQPQTSWLRVVASRGYRWVFGWLLHGLGCDIQSGLKVFPALAIKSVQLSPTPWTFDLEFLVKARAQGFAITSHPIVFSQRSRGESKVDLLKVGWEGIKAALGLKWKMMTNSTGKLPSVRLRTVVRQALGGIALWLWLLSVVASPVIAKPLWQVQSIDTMKYSRDIAREKLKDISFDSIIDQQVRNIADTGATHVAVATPYEAEFVPFLRRWVAAARRYQLKVWFRGNVAGWERWFGYPAVNRETHTQQVVQFIQANPDLFVSGDIFTSCPECENGGAGDPRMTGDKQGFRNFLIAEHDAVSQAFADLTLTVETGYYSMNGDVAKLIMDPATTQALGGVVAIDHYVGSADRMVSDIQALAQQSQGKVIVSEFGAPIPDIHGTMSELEQAQWIAHVLVRLQELEEVVGVNYWVNVGGSTELWSHSGKARLVVEALKQHFYTQMVEGVVLDQDHIPLSGATISLGEGSQTSEAGTFTLTYQAKPGESVVLVVTKEGFHPKQIVVDGQASDLVIVLEPIDPPSWFARLQRRLKRWYQERKAVVRDERS